MLSSTIAAMRSASARVKPVSMLELTHDVQAAAGARSTAPSGAAPAYLATHGKPRTPEQLRTHHCITHAHVGRTEWRLRCDGQSVKVPVSGPLQCNEVAVMRRAAPEGLGIVQLPTYYISEDLAQGRLVRVLRSYEPDTLGIHAVYLSRQYQPLLLRAMLDFLAERFGGDVAPWDRAVSSAQGR